MYKDIVGSAYYIAPEVLKQRYGKEIDIWSAGVILYILLSGVPPFWAGKYQDETLSILRSLVSSWLMSWFPLLHAAPPETERGIFDAILKGEIDFESAPWPSISSSAKDLVMKMLKQDPKKRITAAQVLRPCLVEFSIHLIPLGFLAANGGIGFSEHPWMVEGGEASDNPIDSAVLSRMKQFRAMNKMKKMALKVSDQHKMVSIASDSLVLTVSPVQVIAENLSEEEIKGLKQMFTNMDTDKSGTITYDELKTGLARLGSKLSEAEIKQLMDAVRC